MSEERIQLDFIPPFSIKEEQIYVFESHDRVDASTDTATLLFSGENLHSKLYWVLKLGQKELEVGLNGLFGSSRASCSFQRELFYELAYEIISLSLRDYNVEDPRQVTTLDPPTPVIFVPTVQIWLADGLSLSETFFFDRNLDQPVVLSSDKATKLLSIGDKDSSWCEFRSALNQFKTQVTYSVESFKITCLLP